MLASYPGPSVHGDASLVLALALAQLHLLGATLHLDASLPPRDAAMWDDDTRTLRIRACLPVARTAWVVLDLLRSLTDPAHQPASHPIPILRLVPD